MVQQGVHEGHMIYTGNGDDLQPVLTFRAAVFVQDWKTSKIRKTFCPTIFCCGGSSVCRIREILWKKGPSTGGGKADNPEFLEAGDEAEIIFEPQAPFIVSPTNSKLKRLIVCNGTILSMLGRVLEVTRA